MKARGYQRMLSNHLLPVFEEFEGSTFYVSKREHPDSHFKLFLSNGVHIIDCPALRIY